MPFIKITEHEIRSLADTKKVYDLGIAYALNDRVSQLSLDSESNVLSAVVMGTWLYDVRIVMRKNGSIASYNCNCPAFEEYPGACKHVIATLKAVQRKLTGSQPRAVIPKQSVSDFMALFTKPEQKMVHEELNLELELEIFYVRQVYGQLQLKVGQNRLYVVKDLEEFLFAIQADRSLKFGKQFTYDPLLHTFSEEDQKVVDMLQDMLSQYNAFNEHRGYHYASPFSQKPFVLNKYYLGKFLDALGQKVFSLTLSASKAKSNDIPRSYQIISQDIPLDFAIKSKEQDLALALKSKLPLQLTEDGRYYLYDDDLYKVSQEQQAFLPNLIKTLSGKSRQTLTFPAHQKDYFASEAIPLIEKLGSVSIEPKLAKRFVREELQAKIYFDKLGEYGIRARLEFHYGSHCINPFTAQRSSNSQDPADQANSQILIRNIDIERKILDIFEQAEFTVSQGTISLEDDEKIFDFTMTWLPQLQECAETFYSDNFKLKIRTSTSFSGRVRLDETSDLLEISFEYSDIDGDELANIFHSLQVKRKYYRLRDGSFLDLKQPELESMATFLDYLNLKGEDLQDQTLQLPKFRAMYIDSFLRQANLPGIQRNKAFKQLVQSILEPQDGEFDPPASLKDVLRDYQKTGFQWLKTLASYGLGGILADDMGLGKTLQTLAFILSEKNATSTATTPFAPALVIAPTSLVYNWQAEGEKFAPDLNILVVDGTPQERQEQLKGVDQADLVVTSYALLRRDIEYFSEYDFSYCFLDEAQNIKNPQTLNAKSVQRIKAKSYFALTGTPIENSLSELWSLFNFCMPGYLLSHQDFQKKYGTPIIKGEDPQALIELSRHTKPFILRRLKKDVLKELPPKIETEIKATLTEEQRKIYLAYLQQTKSQIAQELATNGFARSQIQILAALTRLRQICSHPGMFIDNYTGESGKMLLFQELLADTLASGHRVLVFSQFTSMLDIIRDYLLTENIEYFYLSGSTPALERSQMATAFNQGQGQVFLISLKAGGTGLNLIGADTVIHFDPWWNPAVEDQATDRAHRIGQQNSVQVIKLLTQGTIEEKVNALQVKKKKLIDSVIQPGETMLSRLTEQELRELFELT